MFNLLFKLNKTSNLTILGIASANLYVLGKDTFLKAGVWLNFSPPNTSL